jgi:hypothetical protein
VAGAVLILIALFVIGPILLFFAGAVWSALMGWMLSEDAHQRARDADADTAAT